MLHMCGLRNHVCMLIIQPRLRALVLAGMLAKTALVDSTRQEVGMPCAQKHAMEVTGGCCAAATQRKTFLTAICDKYFYTYIL